MFKSPHLYITSHNLIFLQVRWFKRQAIIVCQDVVTDEFHFYIGIESQALDCDNNEREDIKHMMCYGATFPTDAGMVLFPTIDYENYSFKSLYPEKFI